jgi:hypothetical protein
MTYVKGVLLTVYVHDRMAHAVFFTRGDTKRCTYIFCKEREKILFVKFVRIFSDNDNLTKEINI